MQRSITQEIQDLYTPDASLTKIRIFLVYKEILCECDKRMNNKLLLALADPLKDMQECWKNML